MKKILATFLKKRGVTDIREATPEEQETYNRWHRILSEGDITVDKIKEFCETQVSIIESKWRSEPESETTVRLIPHHTVYKAIIEAIEAPQKQREELEQYLQEMLDKTPNS